MHVGMSRSRVRDRQARVDGVLPQPVTGWLKRSMPPEKWTSGKIRSTRLQFSTGPIY
jgi:hypothetical protein